MYINKNVIIKNIYYMLTYAFRILQESKYEEISKEEFDNILNLFSAILSKGTGQLLKQGLYREYLGVVESATLIRGKIKLESSITNLISRRQVLDCEYDELSENNIFNQIIKTTTLLLLRSPEVKDKYKDTLKKNILFFKDVDIIDPSFIRWDRILFQKHNQNYRMIISICQLIIEGMLLTTEKGDHVLASFIDDQKMHRLYELFILEYYKKKYPQFKPKATQISWALDEGEGTYLPNMETDVTLSGRDRVLIIDAKFYSKTMQANYETLKIHSGNLYQIFTYVKNKQLEEDNTKKISGMLLYARTDAEIQPDNDYYMSGNKISVKTLDLNKEFSEISRQLNKIVEDYFLE